MTNQNIGKYRWTICALIFFATTVNYLDRAVISLLKPYLTAAFQWSDEDAVINYTNIEIAFKFSYAFGMLFAGKVIDKLGTKIGYALSTCLWSISAIAHALATGTMGFSVARIFLGVTEAGNFPAAIKTVAEWFPKKERALATGIFNSGSNIGAIVAPISVPFIAENWGWQWAFVITGAIGFVWLVLWFIYYEIPSKQKRLAQAEYNYITQPETGESGTTKEVDSAEKEVLEPISWKVLIQYKQTWAFAIGKLLTDPIWWFYLFWLPDFLDKQYGLKGTQVALPVALVYAIASFGSICGGWLPMNLINKGMPVFKARKTSMLIYAFCVTPVIFSQYLGNINMWYAIIVIGIAAAAHQAWSANIFTTVSDMFPNRAIGSVTGIGGMFGGLGGILLSALVQKKLFVYYESIGQIGTGYFIMFIICGAAYLLGWSIMHFLVPTFKKIEL
ncbi:MFS transporter [Flavobacterium sp. JAS]|uniref:MFS transporter n=1 Tax=Flavobacterium sp. JAS TaxID=2897329 RepID=UPI001E51A8B1|nr:MFS transporter [Flavobacterium sp. JAS]MCD0468796.1 MFS transporter [Flavobacterium sp. JAS]